jgi:hypothetical protein
MGLAAGRTADSHKVPWAAQDFGQMLVILSILFELVEVWPDAPNRVLTLLSQFEIQSRFIGFGWNPDFCDLRAAELIVNLVRDPAASDRVRTILLALLRNFCDCEGGGEYLDALSARGLFDHIPALFQRCSSPEQFTALITFVAASALTDPQSVGELLEAVPFERFIEKEDIHAPMVRLFENILLKSEIPDALVAPVLGLLEAFCSVADVSCAFPLGRLLARLCESSRYRACAASFCELICQLICELFDRCAQSDASLLDQFAVVASHFIGCELSHIAPLIEGLFQAVDTGKGTLLVVSTLTEIIRKQFSSGWRKASDLLFRWIVDRLDLDVCAKEKVTVLHSLGSLIGFATPEIVSRNAATILEVLHHVIHCNYPKLLIGVVYGLIELQDVEDILGTGRHVLVDFLAEEGEAFDEILDEESEDLQNALQVLLKFANE